MKSLQLKIVGLSFVLGLMVLQGVRGQTPLGSAFNYQGQIKFNGVPVNDICDFDFTLWDSSQAGATQIGGVIVAANVQVTNGVFTTELDYGASAFNGDARWLEIDMSCQNTGGGPVTLQPRNELTATPNAIFALSASSAGPGGACCDDLSGLFAKAGSGFVSAPLVSTPQRVFLGNINATLYITGVHAIGDVFVLTRVELFVAPPPTPPNPNNQDPLLVTGNGLSWSSGGGAPLVVPTGQALWIRALGPGGPSSVTITYYQFP